MMKTEKIVARIDDLHDGEMKEVSIGEKSILLVRVKGEFHAIGSKCSHYGAPLAQGVLSGNRICCPWHQACFDIVTGDLREPPALDGLPHFDVRLEGENVIVRVPEDIKDQRTLPMAKYDTRVDSRSFVIIGAGAAGNAAAEILRQDRFQGRVIMVTRENHLPYDRPQLSKGYLKQDQSIFPTLRSEKFYSDHDIEIRTNRVVTQVDASDKAIVFNDGSSLSYDKLLLTTGARPRRLNVPGAELQNIFTLRSLNDADQIKAAAEKASRAVVIGASFMGMETAASMTECGLSVTIVAPESIPFERTLGREIGRMYQKLHEENGVSFKLSTGVARFEGSDKVQTVVLDNGDRLKADFVVVGIGVQPVTDFLKGVEVNSDGSVPVDKHLCIAEDLYAAGDVANFIDWRTEERIRIEHWRVAEQHGWIAAHNMAGQDVEFHGIPFFWTGQFGVSVRYVGHVTEWDTIIFQGDPSRQKFVAFYVKHDQVLAAAGCGHDMKMAAIAELMRMNRMPSPKELRGGPMNLAWWLKA
jgi:NADPH-dependent 2,4-dienoyl-CoA reductase/sulfur reductase-like enzyme/nitrite reductase/ring-hydroxylating ferredoxin subunit